MTEVKVVALKTVNLMPETIRLLDENGSVIAEYVPAGVVDGFVTVEIDGFARMEQTGAPDPYRLPDPQVGVIYIVPVYTIKFLKYKALRSTDDLCFPKDYVLDERGRMIGHRSLGRL